jgi:hypothetical protein
MSGDYLQNMKLLQILGWSQKYLNITSYNWLENWVLKIAKYYFYQCAAHHPRTLQYSATSKFCFSQLTIPPSHSLYIWESSMHSYAVIGRS